MLIGELSRRTGVPAHLLRYYETQGLLEPARGAGGYRRYTEDAVLTVGQIRKLLGAGLSTQEIALLLPCATGSAPELEPCPELLDVLRARLRELDERIDTLQHSRRALHGYLASAAGTRRRASSSPAATSAEATPMSTTGPTNSPKKNAAVHRPVPRPRSA